MKKIGVLTSGGDSPGMNAAIRAVVRAGSYHGLEVWGIYRGYQGLIDDQVRVLGPRDVSGIINRGGTIIHTARCKPFFEAEGRTKAAETLRKHGIEGLVVVGGDGSYRGALALHSEHGIRCIGLPGTIDNDIGGTDYTIGYDTALNTAMDAIDRLRDTAMSHDRIFYVEVMGRRSGYLAMMSGIAGGAEEILVPESPTEVERIVEHLRVGQAAGKRSAIIVVAEGDEAGGAFDTAKKIADISEFKDFRVTVIGHLQRGGTPSAFDRLLASRMGVRAVEALLEGETGKMVAINANNILLRPLSETWECRTQFDPGFDRIARILAS
ncbi:MAG: 6-phosphofructokinase [Candidatus Hydrogenedentes bacterium]|nr:6-phosphofructokinase [Candidatus Hydrogenedentota bacterium]